MSHPQKGDSEIGDLKCWVFSTPQRGLGVLLKWTFFCQVCHQVLYMRNTPCTTPALQVYWSWRTPASSCTPGLALGWIYTEPALHFEGGGLSMSCGESNMHFISNYSESAKESRATLACLYRPSGQFYMCQIMNNGPSVVGKDHGQLLIESALHSLIYEEISHCFNKRPVFGMGMQE